MIAAHWRRMPGTASISQNGRVCVDPRQAGGAMAFPLASMTQQSSWTSSPIPDAGHSWTSPGAQEQPSRLLRPVEFHVLEIELGIAPAEIVAAEIFFEADVVGAKVGEALDGPHRAADMIGQVALDPLLQAIVLRLDDAAFPIKFALIAISAKFVRGNPGIGIFRARRDPDRTVECQMRIGNTAQLLVDKILLGR